jgi:hypothetical protein
MVGKKRQKSGTATPPVVSDQAAVPYDEVLATLVGAVRAGCQNFRCDDLVANLRRLRFRVEPASRGKHFTYSHSLLSRFHGGHFNGGHGRNPVMKSCYVKDAIAVLKAYEADLKAIGTRR